MNEAHSKTVGLFFGMGVALIQCMQLHRYLIVPLLLSHVQFAGATNTFAPSRLQSFCERVLISLNIIKPVTRARMEVDVPAVKVLPNYCLEVSNEGASPVVYRRTNRGLFDIHYERYFPKNRLDRKSFGGLKSLDLACGDGVLVEELRRQGFDIDGLDVLLNPYQTTKPYFIQADAARTGLPSESYDLVVSIQGPLSYQLDNEVLRNKIFREIHRLLKPGGRLLLSPLLIRKIEEFPPLPPGLRLTAWASPDWMSLPAENTLGESANFWVEIVKD